MVTWLLLVLFGCREPMSAPPLDPGRDAIDRWGALLERVVQRDGTVDYDLLERERRTLDAYVAYLANHKLNRGKDRHHKLANRLNAFNALVRYQVLERGRPASVLDVPGLPRAGAGFYYWTEFQLGRDHRSLFELAHEGALEATQDYRVFAALALGARSGPPLRAELYDGGRLSAQLDHQFRAFVMGERAVRFDAQDRLQINPIFAHYRVELDLWTHGKDTCALLAEHATGVRKKKLLSLASRGCPHTELPFDWSLDAAP